jgi:hypothetical protein
MLEFKAYSEVDLNDSPIIALGCGHFFTGETLDGMIALSVVYTTDKSGNYDGFQDGSSNLTTPIPSCPECRCPMRQFATKRYSRLLNQVVMEETCKRFLSKGQRDIAQLEEKLQDLEATLESTRKTFNERRSVGSIDTRRRYSALNILEKEATRLEQRMNANHQPTKKLLDAIRTRQSTVKRKDSTNVLTLPAIDRQVTLGAGLVRIKVRDLMLRDKVALNRLGCSKFDNLDQVSLNKLILDFLKSAQDLISQAQEANLPRIVIQGTLAYTSIGRLYSPPVSRLPTVVCITSSNGKGSCKTELSLDRGTLRETARSLLDNAVDLLNSSASHLPDADTLRPAMEAMRRLFEESRYEKVTADEVEAIRAAMVSGPRGIASHSGHWYNCINGHPVSSLVRFQYSMSSLACWPMCQVDPRSWTTY